jgi:hypothetical protein
MKKELEELEEHIVVNILRASPRLFNSGIRGIVNTELKKFRENLFELKKIGFDEPPNKKEWCFCFHRDFKSQNIKSPVLFEYRPDFNKHWDDKGLFLFRDYPYWIPISQISSFFK